MPVDYSKWDTLELSDDSDIEVHPNVDKRSFIRAKQNQIHMEREHRKRQIAQFKYERVINDQLMARISSLLAALRAHAAEAAEGPEGSEGGTRKNNLAEVAFRAVMDSVAGLDPKDDMPPPRPAGVASVVGGEDDDDDDDDDGDDGGAGGDNEGKQKKKGGRQLPTYTRMMATLLDQVNKTMDEKKVGPERRYEAMLEEIGEHLKKVENLQKELLAKLAELEKEEGRKITSASIHTGFDSSHISKAGPSASGGGGSKASSSQAELLNPSFAATSISSSSPAPTGGESKKQEASTSTTADDDNNNEDGDDDDDDNTDASPAAQEFGKIKMGDYSASLDLLSRHPDILAEKETDGLLIMAFDAQLSGRDEVARNYVHQALLLQYCRALGRDGVALFFRRVTTQGHQAREVFLRDVHDTHAKIQKRAVEINAERAAAGEGEAGKGEGGVEQIQLHAVEPGTAINIRVPPADSDDEEVRRARAVFDAFPPRMRRALETNSLDEVNKVLGAMTVEEAERMVELFGEANVLSLCEGILDTTSEEGQEKLKQMEREAAERRDEDEDEAEAEAKAMGPTPDPE